MVLLATGTACGVDVPDKVCGANVDPELLKKVLPADDEYRESEGFAIPGHHRRVCEVTTGDGHKISIRNEVAPNGADPLKALNKTVKDLKNPKRISIGHKAAVGNAGIITHAHCKFRPKPSAKAEEGEYVLIVKLWHLELSAQEDNDKYRKDLVRFAKNYFPNAMKARGCQGA